MRIVAHRGASCDAPENTFAAFEFALARVLGRPRPEDVDVRTAPGRVNGHVPADGASSLALPGDPPGQ